MFSKNQNLPTQRRFRSDPWASFQDEFKDLMGRFTDDWGESLESSNKFVPKVDVKDKGKEYQVTAEIPGMSEKDLDINLEDNVLTLEGERRSEHKDEDKEKGYSRTEISYGSFYRAIPLEGEVDEDKVEASYKDGMLKIKLPKKEGTEKKSRKINLSKSDTKH